jgi:nitrate reductase assembly molybdenum cofactor insertion protein NarJ
MMSLDRRVDSTSEYNWSECNPMLWSINAAKSSFRLAFETEKNMELWNQDHGEDYRHLIDETRKRGNVDLKEVKETWTVVVEMRKYFCDLLTHYHSHGNHKY